MTEPGETNGGRARVIRRTLGMRDLAGTGGVTRILDAVAVPGGRVVVSFGSGTAARVFAPDGGAGCARPLDLRDVGGAALVVVEGAARSNPGTAGEGRAADEGRDPRARASRDGRSGGDAPCGPMAIGLRDGGTVAVDPDAAEWDILAGLDVLLAFRLDETIAQVAQMLGHHAAAHRAQGAVLVARVPLPDGYAEALAAALAETALRVVLLEPPLPIGKAGMPAESHPILAPDAPGKDRMEVPPHDPWRAPVGEGLILEAIKWRFLARARAVLCLDVSDYLAPTEAGNAFDLCVEDGAVTLAGRLIYPWRVREGEDARFGDHVCRPFDPGREVLRWGCAPGRIGLAAAWRLDRIVGATPARRIAFERAMAIRVPGRSAAELVPKSSLVEDAGLLALASGAFAWKPVRPPVSRARTEGRTGRTGGTGGTGRAGGAGTGRTAIVTTMKNEGPFILEWLAYHRSIGVDDVLVYSNDCTDGTDGLLEALDARGLVQHRDNPFRASGLSPQHAAFQAAEAEPVVRDAGWIVCMDVDEFIDVRIGDGTLAALYAAMGTANMISLTWRLFGNAGLHGYRDGFVTEAFTRCAPEVVRKPHQAWGFKTLFRNIDIYRKLGVHRPKGLVPDLWDRIDWLNGSGRPLPRSMYHNGWRSTLQTYGYDWVQLNHYAVRSAESFLVKRDRGRVNHVDRDQGLGYWFRMNFNAEEDRSIQRMLPAMRVEHARLVTDPVIRAAHDACVAAHRGKIADLMAAETPRAFFGELTSPRMERLCTMQQHFGAAVFQAGPLAIPPGLEMREPGTDWFFTLDAAGAEP